MTGYIKGILRKFYTSIAGAYTSINNVPVHIAKCGERKEEPIRNLRKVENIKKSWSGARARSIEIERQCHRQYQRYEAYKNQQVEQ